MTCGLMFRLHWISLLFLSEICCQQLQGMALPQSLGFLNSRLRPFGTRNLYQGATVSPGQAQMSKAPVPQQQAPVRPAPVYQETRVPPAPVYQETRVPPAPVYQETRVPPAPVYQETRVPPAPVYQETRVPPAPVYQETRVPPAPVYQETRVPPAPVYQETRVASNPVQMPLSQLAPSNPAGYGLGSFSMDALGDGTTSNAGGAEGPSSGQERYLVITQPSGFQTRYVVKSLNRYVRGRRVFSQTTYIPLDFLPSAPVAQPVPIASVPELQTDQVVEVVPARKG